MIYIGIPTINLASQLAMVVKSIKCNEEYKLLVINNNINDQEFITWANSEEAKHCEIITNSSNKGVAASWNQIIKWAIAGGYAELVFILNDDIVLHPNCINRMIETARTQKYGAVSAIMLKGSLKGMQIFNESMIDTRYVSSGMHFSCFALTSKTIDEVGLFDEKYGLCYVEDTDYFYRLEQAKVKKGCDRYAWFVHYQSKSRNIGGLWSSHRKNRRYFRRKWGLDPGRVYRRLRVGNAK